MSLSHADVEKVALLSRLQLSADELRQMTAQLAHVLDYIQQLEQVDTSKVEPLAHPIDLMNVLAEDVHSAGLEREEALAAAPKRDDECFLVPAVLGD